MTGIKRISEVGNTKITLVTTISRLNFDAINPMAKLARSLRVGISYNAVEPTVKSSFEDGRTELPVQDYGLSKRELEVFYLSLLRLKHAGFPLMETQYVLKHFVEGRAWGM